MAVLVALSATLAACGDNKIGKTQSENSEQATAATSGVPTDFEKGPDIVGVDNVDWWTTADDGTYRSDSKTRTAGSSSIRLTSGQQGYGDLTQNVAAAPFAGKRLTFSGSIKTEAATGEGATIQAIVSKDGATEPSPAIRLPAWVSGTSEWKRYEISFPVPAGTDEILLALLLRGDGTAWFDDLEVID
jgi:hypothetical protein